MGHTILLVDDDASIRQIERRYLERDGYHVLQAAGPREAIELVESGRAIDLLITDLAMPEMSGAELVAHLRPNRPALKVLYVSGRLDGLCDSLADTEGVLQKPFTRGELGDAVSSLLFGRATERE